MNGLSFPRTELRRGLSDPGRGGGDRWSRGGAVLAARVPGGAGPGVLEAAVIARSQSGGGKESHWPAT